MGYHSACLNPSNNVALSTIATFLREMLCTMHEMCSFESATFKINLCSACNRYCQISAKKELKHEFRNTKVHDYSSYGCSFEKKQYPVVMINCFLFLFSIVSVIIIPTTICIQSQYPICHKHELSTAQCATPDS